MAHSLDDGYISFLQRRQPPTSSSYELHTAVLDDGEAIPTTADVEKEFTLFRDLPTELRLKVWECAVFERTIVAAVMEDGERGRGMWEEVLGRYSWGRGKGVMGEKSGKGRGEQEGEGEGEGKGDGKMKRRWQRRVPPVLQICRESREVGLKWYDGMGFSWREPPTLSLHRESERGFGIGINTGELETASRNLERDPALTAHRLPQTLSTIKHPPIQALRALSSLVPLSPSARRKIHRPRLFFCPDRDTLLLAGDLEPWDAETGLSHPAAYFFMKEEARRVRKLALPLGSLGVDVLEAEDVGTVVWHVVDRFTGLEGGRLEVWVRGEEGKTLGLGVEGAGGCGKVKGWGSGVGGAWEEDGETETDGDGRDGGRTEARRDWGGENNIVMKIWRACMGMHATSSAAGQLRDRLRIVMVGVD